MRIMFALLSAVIGLATICSCGGGGSSASQTTGQASQITGVAAKGAALGNARLQVCGTLNGSASQVNTTTSLDGSYAVDTGRVQGPFLIRVEDATALPAVWYYSFASATGSIANVNPYADIIIRTWFNVNAPGTVIDTDFCQSSMPVPVSADITSIEAQTKKIMKALYPALQGQNLGSVISSAWQPGSGYDGSLDAIGQSFLANVQSTVQTVTANPDLLKHFLLRSGVQNQFHGGTLTKVQPMLHSEVFISASQIETAPGVITLPELSCPGRGVIPYFSGTYTDSLGVICPAGVASSFCYPSQSSAIAGTYDIFVYQDQVSSMITGNCTLKITKSDGSLVTINAPVIQYKGTGVTNLSGTAGNTKVTWTNPADLSNPKPPVSVYFVGFPQSASNPGRIDAITTAICPDGVTCSDTLPIASSMGFSMLLTGANGEMAETWYYY